MIRGTTPVLPLRFTNIDNIQQYQLRVIFEQKHLDGTENQIIKTEYTIDDGVVYVPLTQEETLSLEKGTVLVQVRGINSDGYAWATNVASISVIDILDDGVIEYVES